jgi:hypothetical protein
MSELINNTGQWVDLKCHPSSRWAAVHSIQVLVRRPSVAELQITFRIEGDISQIQVPAQNLPRFNAELWRHTCCETFVSIQGQPEYCELNFAPSREWAVFAFSGYRSGRTLADKMPDPHIVLRPAPTRLELDAAVRLDALPPGYSRASLRIGLSAVIEASEGYSYWALTHPAEKPDFHNADGFALLLDAPTST